MNKFLSLLIITLTLISLWVNKLEKVDQNEDNGCSGFRCRLITKWWMKKNG